MKLITYVVCTYLFVLLCFTFLGIQKTISNIPSSVLDDINGLSNYN